MPDQGHGVTDAQPVAAMLGPADSYDSLTCLMDVSRAEGRQQGRQQRQPALLMLALLVSANLEAQMLQP